MEVLGFGPLREHLGGLREGVRFLGETVAILRFVWKMLFEFSFAPVVANATVDDPDGKRKGRLIGRGFGIEVYLNAFVYLLCVLGRNVNSCHGQLELVRIG